MHCRNTRRDIKSQALNWLTIENVYTFYGRAYAETKVKVLILHSEMMSLRQAKRLLTVELKCGLGGLIPSSKSSWRFFIKCK